MTIDLHGSIKTKNATKDEWGNHYFPLEYQDMWIAIDTHSIKTDCWTCWTLWTCWNHYTIPKSIIGEVFKEVIPFIKELKPKVIYR